MVKRIFHSYVTVIVVASILLLVTGSTALAESRQPFTNFSRFFSFPPEVKDNWSTRQVVNQPERGLSAYIFGRKTIIDEAGDKISPSVSFIFETVDNNLGAVEYSAQSRAKMTIPFYLDEVYTAADKLFSWKKAIGYKAHLMDRGGKEYTLYIVYGIFVDNGRTYGAQVIMECKNSVFSEVEPEYKAMLANIGGGQ